MRLAVVTCIHGRPSLTAAWVEYSAKIGKIYAAVTAGDEENITTLLTHGVAYTEVPNEPLGAKHNAAMDLALGDLWDAAIILPSDDFVDPAYVEAATDAIEAGAKYVFPASCAIYDKRTQAAFVLTHRPEQGFLTFGAGRLVSRSCVEAVGPLWTDSKARGLDSDSHARLRAHGVVPVVVGGPGPCLTDVKADEGAQLWPFHTWQRRGRAVGADVALGFLPAHVRQMIER